MRKLKLLYKRIPYALKHPLQNKYNKSIIEEKFDMQKDDNLKYLFKRNEADTWKNNFHKLWGSNKNINEILCAFTDDKIELVKSCDKEEEGPILISVVKNEGHRIKSFINHYRVIGVKKFAILDNNSNDGTREWLCNQDDCEVFLTHQPYSTYRREGWINRLLSHYGFNKWYIVVDSDEHLVYPDNEIIDINQFISIIKDKGYSRVRSLMLDMYPKEEINPDKTNIDSNYISQYSYFDKDTYTVTEELGGLMVKGGPRQRIFNLDVYLTKHPIFYFQAGDIQGHSHYQYPYNKNQGLPCFSALLHYKFLNSDLKKYEERVKSQSFYNGSEEYKQYLELFKNNKDITFYYENSKKYENSKSLLEIDFIKHLH